MTETPEFTELAEGVLASGTPIVLHQTPDKAREIVKIPEAHKAVLVLNPGQRIEQFDLTSHLDEPTRKIGHVAITDAPSLIEYVGRHKHDNGTTLWHGLTSSSARIIAILNDHMRESDNAGWGDHRATLTLAPSLEWAHWLSKDGQLLGQEEFAQHLEDGADSIVEPSSADMLEVATSIHASSGTTVKSTARLSGEIEFSYERTESAKAGQNGKLRIPETFKLGLAPFEGSEAYGVTARFRYRQVDGSLRLGYRLIRAQQVRQAAFRDVVTFVHEGLDLPVMAGTPR